jgi:hypothetical protein
VPKKPASSSSSQNKEVVGETDGKGGQTVSPIQAEKCTRPQLKCLHQISKRLTETDDICVFSVDKRVMAIKDYANMVGGEEMRHVAFQEMVGATEISVFCA